MGDIEIQSDVLAGALTKFRAGSSKASSVGARRLEQRVTAATAGQLLRRSRQPNHYKKPIKGRPANRHEGLPVGPRAPVLYARSHAGLPRAGARGTS